MALFKVYRGVASKLPPELHDGYAYFTTDDGKFYIDTASKRTLINPDPQDGVEIDTTEGWASKSSIVSKRGVIYVYSDYQKSEGKDIPAIKIGDGLAYIIDLPFINTSEMEHINNTDIHVTTEEKESWNNKVRAYYSATDAQTVVFTTN